MRLPAQVRFGTPHCNGAPAAGSLYHLEPAALDLAPGASGTVTISFAPRDAKDYAAEVPIFLGHGNLPSASRPGTSAAAAGSRMGSPAGGQRGGSSSSGGSATAPAQQTGGPVLAPYMQLELQGLGKFAALTFDVRECVLPPVPLGESAIPRLDFPKLAVLWLASDSCQAAAVAGATVGPSSESWHDCTPPPALRPACRCDLQRHLLRDQQRLRQPGAQGGAATGQGARALAGAWSAAAAASCSRVARSLARWLHPPRVQRQTLRHTARPLNACQVSFPEGTIIGLAKGRLPVHVSFSSEQPLAFTAPLDLLDEAGMRYSLLVTAVADNSLASHAAFWEVGGWTGAC